MTIGYQPAKKRALDQVSTWKGSLNLYSQHLAKVILLLVTWTSFPPFRPGPGIHTLHSSLSMGAFTRPPQPQTCQALKRQNEPMQTSTNHWQGECARVSNFILLGDHLRAGRS